MQEETFRQYAIGQLGRNVSSPEDWLAQQRLEERGADAWKWFFDFEDVLPHFRGRWGQLALECGLLVPADYYARLTRGAAFQRLQMLDPTREVACFYDVVQSRFSEARFKNIIILPLVLKEGEFYGTLIDGITFAIGNATETQASKIFLHSWAYSEDRARAHAARQHMCDAFEQALNELVAV